MLVTFSSKAGVDVLMLGEHAKAVISLAGKINSDPLPVRGVFSVDQLPDAILRLKAAIDQEPSAHVDDDETDDGPIHPISTPVSLRQRAFPLLDLLRKANAIGEPVLWETGSGW